MFLDITHVATLPIFCLDLCILYIALMIHINMNSLNAHCSDIFLFNVR